MRPTSLFIARREPSGLSFMLIFWCLQLFSFTVDWTPGCAAVLNNCPGYSRVTIYSFCAVLCRTLSSHVLMDILHMSFWIFFGMVFHAQMIDVARPYQRISISMKDNLEASLRAIKRDVGRIHAASDQRPPALDTALSSTKDSSPLHRSTISPLRHTP